MAELRYWIWLSEKRAVSLKNIYNLLDYFGSPEQIYFARENDFKAFDFDCTPLLDKSLADVNRIMGECEEKYIDILTVADGAYPSRLKQIFDPPLVLYTKGKVPFIDEEAAIAIVGTRNCSSYGVMMSERMSYEITRAGGLVVTGLARGIDSAAARGALRANGKVVGVLGNGIDVVYPASSTALYEDLVYRGCLISEYPPGTRPEAKHFPMRNRIMSGLSVGVLVVEAPAYSGALITASRAADQGRDVFVLPGLADDRKAEGSNQLLRDGAIPVFKGSDVMSEYIGLFPQKLSNPKETFELDFIGKKNLLDKEFSQNDDPKTKRKSENTEKKSVDKPVTEDYIEISVMPGDLTAEELAIIKAISEPNTHIDTIIERTSLTASEVTAAMTMLELNGYVKQSSGKRYTAYIKISEA